MSENAEEYSKSLLVEEPVEDDDQTQDNLEEIDNETQPDTLEILDGNTIIKFTDGDEVIEKKWHEIQGSTMLKAKYDKWVNEEKAPLETKLQEAQSALTEYEESFQTDPVGFTNHNIKEIEDALREDFPGKDYRVKMVVVDGEDEIDLDAVRNYLRGEPVKETEKAEEVPLVDKDKLSEAVSKFENVTREQIKTALESYKQDPEIYDALGGIEAAISEVVKVAPKTRERRTPAKAKASKDFFKGDPERETKEKLLELGMIKLT